MAKIHINSINQFEDTFTLKGGRKIKYLPKVKKLSKFKKEY